LYTYLHQNFKKLSQLLDARQLALKLIANVTYGYTAANWSGRMPCEEVADAIVSKGREALEKAIKMVHEYSDEKYDGARVVYGDTDSLFIVITGLWLFFYKIYYMFF
jgi:DNA polymerase zeta